MFLSHKNNRLSATAKARLNTHQHKIDNIESRKKSPDSHSSPPSPSEVIVFNNTSHAGNGSSRHNQTNRNIPEVPQIEEINRFLRETWERKMREVKAQNLSIKYITH